MSEHAAGEAIVDALCKAGRSKDMKEICQERDSLEDFRMIQDTSCQLVSTGLIVVIIEAGCCHDVQMIDSENDVLGYLEGVIGNYHGKS
jgi:hypothetical protein